MLGDDNYCKLSCNSARVGDGDEVVYNECFTALRVQG